MKPMNSIAVLAAVAGSAMLNTAVFAFSTADPISGTGGGAIEHVRIVCEPFGPCFRIDPYGRRIVVPRPFGFGRPGFDGPEVRPDYGQPGFYGRPGVDGDLRFRERDGERRPQGRPGDDRRRDDNGMRRDRRDQGDDRQRREGDGQRQDQGAGQQPHQGNGQNGNQQQRRRQQQDDSQ